MAKAWKTGEKLKKKGRLRNVIIYLILLAVIIILTNPNLYFFLNAQGKADVAQVMSGLLGDMSTAGLFSGINWVTVIQLVIMIILMLFVNALAQWIMSLIKPKNGRMKTILSISRSVAKYGTVLIGFVWGLGIVGVNVSTIFASIGVLALVVSFGAESLIEDVITGVFMLVENQFQVGDIIEVDGFRGTVTAITIRTTSVTDAGDNTKIFNNSDMKGIVNLSEKNSLAICDVDVAYETDLEKIRTFMTKELPEIKEKHGTIFRADPEYLGVQKLGESGVTLRIAAKVGEKDRFTAARIMNEELKTRLERNGFSIPFPQVVVHMPAGETEK